MKFILVYEDKDGTPMQYELNASSRDDAFRRLEQETGCKAICEKWQLMDPPSKWIAPQADTATSDPVEYPRPVARKKNSSLQKENVQVATLEKKSIIDSLPKRSTNIMPTNESKNQEDDQSGFGFLGMFIYEIPFFLFGALIIAAENYFLFGIIETLIPNPFFLEMCMCAPFILFPIAMSFVLGAPLIISPIMLTWLSYSICKA